MPLLNYTTSIPPQRTVMEIQAALAKATEQTAKAYGGCKNCYGKSYASVNDRWKGLDTDTDIGSPGGWVSGGDASAMKFCTCERGKELEKRFNAATERAEVEGRIQVLREVVDNPNRKSYFNELLNNELKRLHTLSKAKS